MFKNMGFPGSSPNTGQGGPGAQGPGTTAAAGGGGPQPGGGHPMVPTGMGGMGGMGGPMGMGMGMMNGLGVPMGMGGMMGGAGANTLMMMGTSEDMYPVDEDLEGGDADGEHQHDVGGDMGMGVGLGDVEAMGVGMGVGGDADLHDAHHALAFGDHDGLGDAELADQEHDHDRAALLTGALGRLILSLWWWVD